MRNRHSFERDIRNNKMITKNKIKIKEPITNKGYNLLHIALINRKTELISFLIDHPDIDFNFVSKKKGTILMSLHYRIY